MRRGEVDGVSDVGRGVQVDLFSLGIIFFEVCQPFATGMERAEVL